MRNSICLILLLSFFGACNRETTDYGGFATELDTEFGRHLKLTFADTLGEHLWEDGTLTQHKGTFLVFHGATDIDTLFVWLDATVIESHINNVKFDSNYITIDQKPLDLIFGKIESKNLNPHRPNWPGNADNAERMLIESLIHRYWIIDKNTKEIYGGYKKEVFDTVCKELKIPHKLNF